MGADAGGSKEALRSSARAGPGAGTPEVTWIPTNVLSPGVPDNTLKIRKGDSLLLKATPAEASAGTASLAIKQGATTLATYEVESQGTQAHAFNQAGTFQVVGTYRDGTNPPVVGTLTVEVKQAAFADPDPIIALGYYREWTNPNLPADTVVEVDGRMEVVELPAPAGGGRKFRLRADAAEPRYLLARLNDGTENGPILDQAELKPVRSSSGAQTGIYFVDQYEDGSQLVEMRVVLSDVPDDIRLKFEIFVAGVTFEDGTTVKWFSKADFNEQGELKVRFIRGPGVTNSTCHRLYIYQGDTLLETRTN